MTGVDVAIVGAGFGGLAAAIRLASSGRRVVVLEAADTLGGKAGTATVDGVRFDTGPSVLTLPAVIEDLFGLAGRRMGDHLVLRTPDPAFRYRFDDGVALDLHPDREATMASVEATLGSGAAADLGGFLDYAADVWAVAAPPFVYGEAPSLGRVLALGPRRWVGLWRADPLRSMWGAIRRRVRSPHLRTVLARYATYNGSDPRRAPATLNCIAHVEMGLGGYGIEGGMAALVAALVELGRGLGVEYQTGARVDRITVAGGRVRGVEVSGRPPMLAPAVVANTDAAHLFGALLPKPLRRETRPAPSMSGYTSVFRAAPRSDRAAHTVLLPDPYLAEFEDIFDADRPPRIPSVYLCDQSVCHGLPGWDDAVPVFAMANAPAEPEGGRDPEGWSALGTILADRAVASGELSRSDTVVWSRTPAGLAHRFPGSRGSLYGAASHGLWAAFRRPPNRVRAVRGLALASGSAHPGGGVPLAVLSGVAAARILIEEDGKR